MQEGDRVKVINEGSSWYNIVGVIEEPSEFTKFLGWDTHVKFETESMAIGFDFDELELIEGEQV